MFLTLNMDGRAVLICAVLKETESNSYSKMFITSIKRSHIRKLIPDTAFVPCRRVSPFLQQGLGSGLCKHSGDSFPLEFLLFQMWESSLRLVWLSIFHHWDLSRTSLGICNWADFHGASHLQTVHTLTTLSPGDPPFPRLCLSTCVLLTHGKSWMSTLAH